MSKLSIAIALFAAACGGKQPTTSEPPSPTTPAETAPMSPEACTAQGGQVRGDIGDGQIKCGDGERDLGRVNQGIEGAVCCAPPTAS